MVNNNKDEYLKILLFFIGIILFWQLMILLFDVPNYILPTPIKILDTMIHKSGYLINNLIITLTESIIGFVLGSIIGVILALLIASFRFLEKVLYPLLIFTQVTPKIAVAPLFIIWFGYGLLPKVVIAALMSFFPVVINTVKGLRKIHPDLLNLMRSLSATKRQVILKIRLPSSIPYLFSALKLSVTLSVIGAVIGEFIGSDKGLGYVIMLANANLDTDLVFASLIFLCLAGSLLFMLIELIEKTFFKRYNYS